jgi:hypothetical protein
MCIVVHTSNLQCLVLTQKNIINSCKLLLKIQSIEISNGGPSIVTLFLPFSMNTDKVYSQFKFKI